jgi:hypothetical protein
MKTATNIGGYLVAIVGASMLIVPDADSDDAEHSFRRDPERHSGMMPNT